MARGANIKREREDKEFKHQFKNEGRYKGREEEVASWIVNKQRRLYGETKAEHQEEKEGKSFGCALPVSHYRHRIKNQLKDKLKHLSRGEVTKLLYYEKQHKNRKTVMQAYDRALKGK